MKPSRVNPPAVSPVSLGEFKNQVRVDFCDDDLMLQSYIDAAVAHLDGWQGVLGRAMVDQDWRISLMCWPDDAISLPFGDVSAASIVYFDEANDQHTLLSEQYEIVETATCALIRFREAFARPPLNTDRSDAVQVTFTTGFGDSEHAVPAPLRVAIMMLAAHWYENRESVGDVKSNALPQSVDTLIAPYRRVFY